jgi:two-component system, chemotaxis family, sensor kinase Cph1
MSDTGQRIDLTNCETEPIHIPGAVQPHGLLLAAEPATERVIQAAGLAELLGRDIQSVLGCSIAELLRRDLLDKLVRERRAVSHEPSYLGMIHAAGGEVDVLAHERDGICIFEFEPAVASRYSAPEILAQMRTVTLGLEAAADLRGVCEIGAREIRKLTGFDRVMIYRFLEDGAGYVFAEDKRVDLPSLLNHHYPASDIPRQARKLYLSNVIRVIPDVAYTPAPLVPGLCTATGQPLDMSACILRSVSPIHIQYLKNMGVAGSMSVSIVKNGVLWGLIACHHTTTKPVSYELRELCKHIGQGLSQQIKAREDAETSAQMLRLREGQEKLLAVLARGNKLDVALGQHCSELSHIIPADDAAICLDGAVTAVGHVPPTAGIQKIAEWRLSLADSEIYATDRLSEAYAAASCYRSTASGLLATVVSREPSLVLLWFRAERIETVSWAGNPHKPVEPGASEGVLNPRRSFALWQETVRGRARPWSGAEIAAAQRFCQGLSDLRQQEQIRMLNRELRRTLADKEKVLEQKDLLMREIHHRVQNSLQIAASVLRLQAAESSDPNVHAQFEEARRRLMAMAMVHRRLHQSDQIGAVDIGHYLRELRHELLPTFGVAWEPHLRVHGSSALVSTDKAITIALIVTELVTNAVKHAYGGGFGPVDITLRIHDSTMEMTVEDQGVGLPQLCSEGFGSKLTRALVSQLRGSMESEDNRPGTRIILRIPRDRPLNGRADQQN